MRTAFIQALCEAAEHDPSIWLVCGDLGYSVLERFFERFPDRFVNAGVAEQNMMGVAAGLALAGKTVFVYSIVNFPVMRCMEQVRNDVCYHRLPVKVVAVGGGLVYGGHGYTHHGVEDLAMMRVLPNMTVVAPADPIETRLATQAIAAHAGPCYLRLGRGGEPILHRSQPSFELGRALRLREGTDVTLASLGASLQLAARAAEELDAQGIAAEVFSVHTLYPLDCESLLASIRKTRRVITVEEHGLGGLGTAVAELLAETGLPARCRSVRLAREPVECAGSHFYLQARYGLTVDSVVAAALDVLNR